MQEIYALSALRALNHSATSRPVILTRDRQSTLSLLVRDAFAFTVMKIIPHVSQCNLKDLTDSATTNASGDELLMSVDLRVSNLTASVATILRVTMQHAIAAYALHVCYISHDDDTSKYYHNIANNEIEALRQQLSHSTTSITPQY